MRDGGETQGGLTMRSRFTVAFFMFVAMLVASCAPVATPPTSSSTASATPAPAKLKVGVLGTTGDAPLYIAFEKGYFREQNLDIEFVQFGSALDMIAPLSAKQLDVGSGGIGAGLFNAFSQG